LIPLGFVKNEATDYSLEIQIPELYPGMLVNLHDIKTGAIHDPGTNPVYNFTAADGDDPNRFEIFFGTVDVDENTLMDDVFIYANGSTINIRSSQFMTGDLFVTNITGKQLIKTNVNHEILITIDGSGLAAGVYLVSFITENGILTKKLILN
jgi:hypothetical protein